MIEYLPLVLTGIGLTASIVYCARAGDVTDIHPEAIGFEAEMSAGRARMAYWSGDLEGFHWVVESKSKKDWNRFTEHHYTSARKQF